MTGRYRCVCGVVDCRKHQRRAWARQNAARKAAYADPAYRRNRRLAIAREPTCHWRLPDCTGRSTTADHLLSLARGCTNDLENLVGACARCNERRGGAKGRATQKRRPR